MATALPNPRVTATYRPVARAPVRAIWRYSAWDGLFVALSLAHAAVLVLVPSIAVIAIGQWWNANTIAHNFIHRPFFRSSAANEAYSAYLSLLLGFPQRLWRERHLLHHAGLSRRPRLTRALAIETLLVFALWTSLIVAVPEFFWFTYVPGWALGLAICQLQGHFEHARGTTSHYGWFYNTLFFNDGLHVEHHQRPTLHWRELRSLTTPTTQRSRWPAVLRWLDAFSLAGLERIVLRSTRLQRWVVAVHERAIRRLVGDPQTIRSAVVVGGGLFPRSAIVLAHLNPATRVTIIERDAEHIAASRSLLPPQTEVRHAVYDSSDAVEADLLVIPLGFVGNRQSICSQPPAAKVLVHDWIWNRPQAAGLWPQARSSVIVSWFLLKRLTLITSSGR